MIANEATPEMAKVISAGLPPSPLWQPLKKLDSFVLEGQLVESWANDRYTVTVRRHAHGGALRPYARPWAQIGIHSPDGAALHDWRDFQRIKNDVVGPQWEAVELYPAESRLVDPSNYYILWAAPSWRPLGFSEGRKLADERSCIAPQRPWAKGDEPPELRA